MPANIPEAPQCHGQARSRHRLTVVAVPPQSSSKIVVLPFEQVEPRALLCPGKLTTCRLSQCQKSVCKPPTRLLELTVFGQFFQRVRADGLEEPKARLAVRLLAHLDKALVCESNQYLEQIDRWLARYQAHRFGCLERAAAAKDAQAAENGLLRRGQRVITPGERRAQRPLPVRHIGRADEQIQAAVQAGLDRTRRKHAYLRSSELDGERQAVQGDADLGDCLRVVLGQAKTRPNLLGTLDKQRYRWRAGEGIQCCELAQFRER